MISLCCISKNPVYLNRMLSVVRPYVDEAIIVSGNENASEISGLCRSFNCRYFYRKFENDFSSQRNFCVDKSQYDWIFVLDDDEVPSFALLNYIYNIDRNKIDSFDVLKINYHHFYRYDDSFSIDSNCNYRFYKKSLGLKYENKVHEFLDVNKNDNIRVLELIDKDHVIYHEKTWEKGHESNDLYNRIKENETVSSLIVRQNANRISNYIGNVGKRSIGAFYYSWYIDPEWSTKTHRKAYGGAPRSPVHGWYNSMELGTIEHHIKLAKEYGIDFFIVSYNGDHDKDRIDFVLSQFERLGMKYCIHYETINVFNQNPIVLNYHFLDKFVADIEYLSEKYCRSDNHFKINGKPVLFIYVTRRILSNNLLEIRMLRKQIKDKFGLDLIIVGDEIWHDFEPSDYRLKQLDAVFAYNLYVNEDECGNKRYTGKDYIDFISKVYYKFYNQCKRCGVGLFPNIMPRYNDDAVRTVKGHYPLPPENGKFFMDYYEGVKKFSIPLGGEEILLVTSFNEWFEDTQIEPFWGGSNKASDEYDRNPYYGNLYLEKILEIKNSDK